MDHPLSRLFAVRETLKRRRLEGFLVTDMTNVRYLSGFTGSSGFLFITKDKNFFVSDFRYKKQAEQEVCGWDIVIEKGNRMEVIENLAKKTAIKVLGFESSVSYMFYRKLSKAGPVLNDTEGLVEKIREIKDAREIKAVAEAVRRAEQAFLEVKPYLKKGAEERAIALRLEDRLKKNGCRSIPFDIIVASGLNSAMPHAKTTGKKFQEGDLVTIDWGGEADGYFSDMTRTFLLKGGRNAGKKKGIYQIVLEANKRSISSVAPGVLSKKIDSAARNYIKNAGYNEYFGHGTGHGTGLQVHEAPRITWTKSVILRENMIFTIEPGIYIPELGGVRIEDMVAVKPRGCKVLTSLPKKLEIIY
jgi:Xaa-Pro aminopeptidase